MEKVQDYTHPTPHGGQCRVRIYQGGINPWDVDELPVVICTELPDNEGMSINRCHPHVLVVAGAGQYSLDPSLVTEE